MKLITIFSGVAFPLFVGLLHHEVREAISVGRWSTVVGSVLGFNGLFALIGGILATIFTVKARTRAAWISIGIATLVSAGMSAFSGTIRDRVAIAAEKSAVQKIIDWNHQQHGKILLGLQKCGLPKTKVWKYGGERAYEVNTSAFSFSGTFENRSAEKIVAVVVDFKVANKDQKQVILTRRLLVPLEVFPTATITIEQTFTPIDYADGVVVDEIHRAADQLNAAYSWSYDFIAAIPQSLAVENLRKSLKIDAALLPKE